MHTSEKRKYELMVIFSGDIAEKDVEKESAEVRKFLTEANASIFHEETWGKRDMTFKIKKQQRGYYVIFDFEALPSAILEIRGNVKLYPAILRHMMVALPEDYDPEGYKKVMLKPKSEDEDQPTGVSSHGRVPGRMPVRREDSAPAMKAPVAVAGKEDEEKLKKVEKKLEQILENPDIDVN